MQAKLLVLSTSAIVMAGQLLGQPQPVYFQTLNCIKVLPGKRAEYRQFVEDTTRKVMQVRADAGEILSWTLLRSVMPAGEEARCDYMVSSMYEGTPRAPIGREEMDSQLKKAGVKMNASDFAAKRDTLTRLVSTELWRPRIRVGQPQKGHYLFLNYMKVHDAAEYFDYENTIWRPMAEEWVKEGSLSGWVFSTKVMPSGTDTVYAAYSADMFPSWDAAFKTRPMQAMFNKVHAGKNYQQTTARLTKLRDLARRELLVVEDRVTKR
jgi:hypothetical protein